MKKAFKYFLSSLVLYLATINASAVPSVSAADALSHLLSNFHSLSAHFTQIIYDANKKPIQTISGTLALSRPGNFHWEVKQPNSQILIANERYLWIYDVDLSQATRQTMDKTKISSPASLLSGSVNDLESRFNIMYSDPNSIQSFKLTPKNKEDLFKWIELNFDNGKLSRMKLFDNLGTWSVFQFTAIYLNPNLSPSLFQFKAPKGVAVIQN